jgi:hypothetical protein
MNLIEKFYRYCLIAKDAGTAAKGDEKVYNNIHYTCVSNFSSSATSCAGNIWTKDGDPGKIVVTFKGSKEAKDWFRDAWIWKIKWPFSNKTGRFDKVKIHSGFRDQWGSVRTKVIRELDELIKAIRSRPPQPKGALITYIEVVFCGHSLGGALTSLAVLDVQDALGDVAVYASYSFASPRVYNPAGAQAFNGIIHYSNRMVYGHDIVPQMPVIDYKHVCSGWYIGYDFKVKELNFERPFWQCTPMDHFVDAYLNALRFANNNQEIISNGTTTLP